MPRTYYQFSTSCEVKLGGQAYLTRRGLMIFGSVERNGARRTENQEFVGTSH